MKTNRTTNYSVDQLYTAIHTNCPVYMQGRTSNSGHAWVCDGYNSRNYVYILTAYALFGSYPINGLFKEDPYIPQYDINESSESILYYAHLNWGWGTHNSWNRIGDYYAPNGDTYNRNTDFF